jgi:hypothetical protein
MLSQAEEEIEGAAPMLQLRPVTYRRPKEFGIDPTINGL